MFRNLEWLGREDIQSGNVFTVRINDPQNFATDE
jgi:hypothetical protein